MLSATDSSVPPSLVEGQAGQLPVSHSRYPQSCHPHAVAADSTGATVTSPVTRFCHSDDMRRRECILGATAAEWTTTATTPDAIRRADPASASNSCGFWSVVGVVGRHGGV